MEKQNNKTAQEFEAVRRAASDTNVKVDLRSSLTDDEQKQAIWIAIRAIDTCTENVFIVED